MRTYFVDNICNFWQSAYSCFSYTKHLNLIVFANSKVFSFLKCLIDAFRDMPAVILIFDHIFSIVFFSNV